MSRIAERFQWLKERGERAFIPFVTAGDPSLEETKRIVHALESAGADLIELGIPYSDPLADGPTIQAAALRSLAQGTRMPDVFELVRQLRAEGVRVPLLLFTYVNPVIQWGVERFFQTAAEIGADGVIIPDLPAEEADEAREAAKKYGVDLIPLVAPTSIGRIAKICAQASGFIYCVSSLGVTGVRSAFAEGLPAFVQRVRNETSLPVAVGFGVGTPEQAREIGMYADGVIVGSALVKRVAALAEAREAADSEKAEAAFAEIVHFAESLKAPLRENRIEKMG
jgi:tryptophan synthase alpha chain